MSSAASPPSALHTPLKWLVGGAVLAVGGLWLYRRSQQMRLNRLNGSPVFSSAMAHPIPQVSSTPLPGGSGAGIARALSLFSAKSSSQSFPFEMERNTAIRAVRLACVLERNTQRKMFAPAATAAATAAATVADAKSVLTKSDTSPVTVADFGGQAVVCSILRDTFPDDSIVGEEDSTELKQNPNLLSRVVTEVRDVLGAQTTPEFVTDAIDLGGGSGGSKGRFWTVDPVDGTLGFLRGATGQYACALALIVDGEVKVGVVGCPNLSRDPTDPKAGTGLLFVGVQNQPCITLPLDADDTTERVVRVSPVSQSCGATFVESVDGSHSSHDTGAAIATALGITNAPKRMDSQVKYCVLARGEADVYLRFPKATYTESIWDHAAGLAVLRSAGGTVTDGFGAELDFSRGRKLDRNRGVVCSNGRLHDRVIAAVKSVLPPSASAKK